MKYTPPNPLTLSVFFLRVYEREKRPKLEAAGEDTDTPEAPNFKKSG